MTSSMEEGGVEPQTVDQARDAVERSRERISRTLDRLEDRIVEKKHELQDKADVLRPVKSQVRHRPLTMVAVAVGVGALLGSLGGGHEDADRGRHGRAPALSDNERRELRDWRRHRRERLRALAGDDHERESRPRPRRHSTSRRDSLKGQLMGAATTAITAAITSRVRDYVRGGSGDASRDRIRDHDQEYDHEIDRSLR
jgi:ElaB/YqjD/DUF883 family membrane-anchored ribosome-binding protein